MPIMALTLTEKLALCTDLICKSLGKKCPGFTFLIRRKKEVIYVFFTPTFNIRDFADGEWRGKVFSELYMLSSHLVIHWNGRGLWHHYFFFLCRLRLVVLSVDHSETVLLPWPVMADWWINNFSSRKEFFNYGHSRLTNESWVQFTDRHFSHYGQSVLEEKWWIVASPRLNNSNNRL